MIVATAATRRARRLETQGGSRMPYVDRFVLAVPKRT